MSDLLIAEAVSYQGYDLQMSDNRSDASASRAETGSDKPAHSKADVRKQRLAAQLRENLKKRKELARSRKTSDEGDN